jgi:hypothetical protein
MVPNFTVKTNNNFVPIKGHTLYTDGTLFHGKYYQGIEEVIDCNENRIVFSCKAPNIPSKDQGQFPVMSVNAFFADIQYQGIVVWAQKFKNGAKSLPLQTKAVNLYQDVPFDKTLWVCIDIVNQNDFKVMANCTVYDENGKVFMYSEDAAVTVSKELNW